MKRDSKKLRVDFRTLASIDMELVRCWLERSHVRQWWRDDGTSEFFRMLEYGNEPPAYIEMFIADLKRYPIGYIETRWASQDTFGIWKNVAEVTDDTVAIKFLIGEKSLTNLRIGRTMISDLILKLFEDQNIGRIIAAPHPDNWPGNIMLKRIGFRYRGRIKSTGVNAVLLTLSRNAFNR